MNTRVPLGAHRLVFLAMLLAAAGCDDPQRDASAGEHAPAGSQEYERGPHNGRLLRDGDFALEITIYESGVPPEFRVYPYRDDRPIDPGSVGLVIELGRLGDRVDRFDFAPQGDYLRGDGVVLEPHSFDVTVSARLSGRESQWHYESYEGRTQIDPAVAEAMGIAVGTATSGTIRETITVPGTLQPHPDAVAEVRGRYPGIVQSLTKAVGDPVDRGEELARLQSNESLQTYAVTAPQGGTVVARNAAVGSSSTGEPIYVIADTSRLVADFKVYARDLDRVAVGQPVRVRSLDGAMSVTGTIERILPTLDPGSRTATARVELDGAGPAWRAGLFVEGAITVAEVDVPLAVRESGLQAFRDFTVVYARVGDTYEVRMLQLGRHDGEFVEVLGGLEPGTTYVTENSYLVKADIEKSGASHDH